MFATIAGRYPLIPGDPAVALDELVGDQVGAGLGMLGDGQVRVLAGDADVDAAVLAWRRMAERTVELTRRAGIASPLVKACLAGPLSTPGPSGETTGRIRAAIVALLAAGAPVVQVDEPWLTSSAAASDAGRARATRAWVRLLDEVAGHVTLGIPGGGATAIGVEALAAAPFASYLVDLVTAPDDWRTIARLPGERGLVLGVADLRTARPDPPAVLAWAARYAASMHGRGLARVGLAPSSGLEAVPREVVRRKLAGLAEAARLSGSPPPRSPASPASGPPPRASRARSPRDR